MRVLVTGGAGYLGSVVARTLLRAGYHVRVLDSLLFGGDGLVALYLDDHFEFTRGDVRSAEMVEQSLRDTDAVVHLAALVGDPACARQPEAARDVNTAASLQVFRLCQREGIQRLVFASTCSNYGKMTDPTAHVTETSELRPISLYAESKVAVEKTVLEPADSRAPAVTVLRFATLFGLSPRMRFDLTVNEFTMELATRRRLEIYGSQFWRPYLHVRDAARAIAAVLEAPTTAVAGQVFNTGDTGQNYQKGQLVEMIRARIGGTLDIRYLQQEKDPRDYRVDFSKIQRILGFRITRTVEDGIREIVKAISGGVLTRFDRPEYRNCPQGT